MIELDARAELERLAPSAAAGDEDAVEEVLRIAHPLVHRYCTTRLESVDHPHATADDVTQDVCLALMSALRTYENQGKSLLSFIFGIAAHKVSDARRRATRWSAPTARSAAAHYVADVEDGPEHHVLRRELRGEMGELVDTLPVRHQQILFMRIIVGMTAEQTARVLDTTPGAIRVAQHRALSHLRARIGHGPAR
ncbi:MULTISPECIES: RNA polymerase sigma factor ShbA [unclassified Rhodococcus (in: high G+C Gram-positive bacteria)]|uniref:RNA polymerase sigma factor ShbA n=1 Tax=unclassified Rhodococcus (in: high G+C Gram-positive bacteria) TaxID=192944 RepID=UPI001639C5ED|nr:MULTISPECIES: RNA polymerase sigma factor ShbA [unclassified Rhodococcus (in: high G+C Gram-positive bacteria)]MBC2639978.1 RNA polymerase sigma factor ShbA [Rhodococcus sp. 3A]MBC2895275.1 RNA polymerase sigma factor ShbA [Rhodococcus sp. 4CII]